MFTEKKGFLLVEASLVLPVFLVAILTLGCLIRAVSAEEVLTHCLTNQARRLSAEAAFQKLDYSNLPSGLEEALEGASVLAGSAHLLEGRLKEQLKEEGFAEATGGVQVKEYQHLFTAHEIDDLIWARVELTATIPLPEMFRGAFTREQEVLCRGFTGLAANRNPRSFAELEAEAEAALVWVFPRAGERYHQEQCTVIRVLAKEQVLTQALRKKYEPCQLCKPDPAAIGSLVYCFPASGTSFHRADCHSVERYVERMERTNAQNRGYTACKVCGG